MKIIPNTNPAVVIISVDIDPDGDVVTQEIPVAAWRIDETINVAEPVHVAPLDDFWAVLDRTTGQAWSEYGVFETREQAVRHLGARARRALESMQ